MSEEIVPYRTKNAAREHEALTQQIQDLIAEARRKGIEPTEVWLGRRELEVFDAAEASSNTCCYASGQRTICGLTVRRSHDDEIRVGVTVEVSVEVHALAKRVAVPRLVSVSFC